MRFRNFNRQSQSTLNNNNNNKKAILEDKTRLKAEDYAPIYISVMEIMNTNVIRKL